MILSKLLPEESIAICMKVRGQEDEREREEGGREIVIEMSPQTNGDPVGS